MKRITTIGLAAVALLISVPALGSAPSTPINRCMVEYEKAYETSYDTLGMLDALGRTELCLADANDSHLAGPTAKDAATTFRARYGALCSLMADASQGQDHTLGRIFNLQCRVEAERGLGLMIESYFERKNDQPSIADWDEEPKAGLGIDLSAFAAIDALEKDLDAAGTVVVGHFLAGLRSAFPDRNDNELENRVVETLAAVGDAPTLCRDLRNGDPAAERACATNVVTFTSGLIHRYADIK